MIRITCAAAAAAILAVAPSRDVSAQAPDGHGVDLNGVWRREVSPLGNGDDIPFLPWAKAVYDGVDASIDAGGPFVDNRTLCLPDGGVDVMFPPYPYQLVQTRSKLYILAEFNNQMRTVHLDAAHPSHLKPSWYGHSIGRWEGDELVVETVGFNERTPLLTLFLAPTRRSNIPHTDDLRVVERYSLSDDGTTLLIRMTIEDPGTFAEPWTIEYSYARREGARLSEFVCADDPRLLTPDNPPDLEGLITVGPGREFPLDVATVAPAR